MVAASVYLAVVGVILTVAYFKTLYRRRRSTEPPIPKGHFLWGNGADFSKHAVKYLHKTQKKLGDIFTIRLLHQHLTVIMDPHSYEPFVKESNFDFDPIQKQVNHNVFSFALIDAKKMLKEAAKKVRGSHLHKGMEQYSKHLNATHIAVTNTEGFGASSEWRTDGLRQFNSKTLFVSMFYTIFGKGKSTDVFEPLTVYKNFDLFHKYFNYLWLGMPVNMFPKALNALNILCKQPNSEELLNRKDLSEYIRFSTQFMLDNGQTEGDIIGHNLVYLHVNYNTFRMAFWTVYYLMQHKEALDALREEIQEVVNTKLSNGEVNEDGEVVLTLEDVDNMVLLDSNTKETLRMCSGVFMVRSVTADTSFEMSNGQKYELRQGDKVAMYPPTIHQDPEIFENPESYKHDRFVNAKFYKYGKEIRNPILSFGSLCPGKKYAITQGKWFLLSLVYKFDFELCDGEATELDVKYYGHEILPPTHDVQMRYRMRENTHTLCFSS
ncbi:7-alpha-hydroxycholest-4-en-3-one 12-alpha-hydroxylase-like [Argopecten irradians]|uniref:7-alpha-hydroxycholest-4-en-3-one 12-alpha-hydroxylase-like n=1 Tax=Argopecten irradians TaxID=31199 RepID=UPI00371EB5AC